MIAGGGEDPVKDAVAYFSTIGPAARFTLPEGLDAKAMAASWGLPLLRNSRPRPASRKSSPRRMRRCRPPG